MLLWDIYCLCRSIWLLLQGLRDLSLVQDAQIHRGSCEEEKCMFLYFCALYLLELVYFMIVCLYLVLTILDPLRCQQEITASLFLINTYNPYYLTLSGESMVFYGCNYFSVNCSLLITWTQSKICISSL